MYTAGENLKKSRTAPLMLALLLFAELIFGASPSCPPPHRRTQLTPFPMKQIALLFVLLLTCVLHAQDYADTHLWAYRENTAPTTDKPVDVFFLCPTTCMRHVDNMDVDDEKERAAFKKAVDMEKGIYDEHARFFAPYYRQKSLPHYGKPAAQEIAYNDVKKAFLHYLEHDNDGRSFVLAGFSQGSEQCLHLIKDVLADKTLRSRLVAAYLIGWCVTEKDTEEAPHLRPAQGETDTGVFIAWNTERADITQSFLVPAGVQAHCINPLNWRTDATPAPAETNKGARFTITDLTASARPGFCGAVINTARGTLNPLFPVGTEIPGKLMLFGGGVFHVYDPIFFYENHRENIGKRIEAYLRKTKTVP